MKNNKKHVEPKVILLLGIIAMLHFGILWAKTMLNQYGIILVIEVWNMIIDYLEKFEVRRYNPFVVHLICLIVSYMCLCIEWTITKTIILFIVELLLLLLIMIKKRIK